MTHAFNLETLPLKKDSETRNTSPPPRPTATSSAAPTTISSPIRALHAPIPSADTSSQPILIRVA